MSCREGKNFIGKWSAPAMYTIGGAGAGFQNGATATAYLLLIMASAVVDKGANGLFAGVSQNAKKRLA